MLVVVGLWYVLFVCDGYYFVCVEWVLCYLFVCVVVCGCVFEVVVEFLVVLLVVCVEVCVDCG